MAPREHSAPPEIDGYEYLELLGGGGFADVFLYQQARPRRKVAVKVVLHEMLSDDARRQFDAEANAMAELSSHPSIVTIYQAGIAQDGRPYLAMEYCPNGNLGLRYRRIRRSPAEVLALGVQIAGAVESAHRAGILHRDIKPANILLTEYNRPALTDFGISITQGQDELDGVGMSVPWSPPETYAEPAWSGPQSDVYSLAATLYSLLARRSPFELPGQANDYPAMIERICGQPLPALERQDVPRALEQVLATAMAKAPASRYASALELGRALQDIQMSMTLPVTSIDVLGDSARIAGSDEGFVSRVPGAGTTERTAAVLVDGGPQSEAPEEAEEQEDFEATVLRRPSPAAVAAAPPLAPAPGTTAGPPAKRRVGRIVVAAVAGVAVLGGVAWWVLAGRTGPSQAAGGPTVSGEATLPGTGVSPTPSLESLDPSASSLAQAALVDPPLAAGTCLSGFAAGQDAGSVTETDCAGPHNAQVYATPAVGVEQYDAAAVASGATQACKDAAADLPRGAEAYDPELTPLVPSEQEWDAGQQAAMCVWSSTRGDLAGTLAQDNPDIPPIPYLPGDCLASMPVSLGVRENTVDCSVPHKFELIG